MREIKGLRWWMIGLIMLGSVINYLTRSTLAVAAPTLLKLEANPDDDFAKEVRAQLTLEPKRYAAYTREYLGWGVFALMAR